jgi:hypothetical protein
LRRAHHFADLQRFDAENKNGHRHQKGYRNNDSFASPLWCGLHRAI